MKEKLLKLATLQKEAVELIKTEDMDGLIAKHQEIQKLAEEMEAEAEEVTTPEVETTEVETPADEPAKTEETEEIKKWSSLNISAESMKQLLEDVAQLKNLGLATVVKTVEEIAKAQGYSTQEQEPVVKTDATDFWGNVL